MPKLILSMDGLVLKEIVLRKERTTIGRKPDNDVQIDNLAISGHHALIMCILNDAFLEDLNSTNGTYVNGQPVKKHVLKNHDVVELGKYRLKFIAETPGAGADAAIPTAGRVPVEETVPDLAEAERAQTATRVFAPQTLDREGEAEAPAGDDRPLGVIQVLSGSNAGRELQLVKSLTTLGRPGSQVAVITRRAHGYYITHVEGGSFPTVNGQMLDAQARRLEDHDIIEIAGVKMEFFLRR